MNNVYEQPSYAGPAALERAIADDDVETLRTMIIGAALYEEERNIVEPACLRLSGHRDEIVRGNAILGFGHIARLFGDVGAESIDAVRRGLSDPSEYVRGQAHAAASDLRHFLGVSNL